MGTTTFTGPVRSGTLKAGETSGANTGPNIGLARLNQFATLIQSGGGLVQSVSLNLPVGSRITSFEIDVLTAFDSATSATLSIGTTAGDTKFVSGINAKTAGRAAISYTAAQLAAMAGLTIAGAASPNTAPLVITVTSVGAPTAGVVAVAVNYTQQ
jgi:hypothetical protein